MARTALLSNEELLFLRQAIIDKFRQTSPYAQEFKPNAFLPNYDELKQSMEAALPDMAPSISLKRLRKLFYDTDHERRGPEKVAKPNFGVDFLDACYLYITDGKSKRYDYLLNDNEYVKFSAITRNKVVLLVAGILFIGIFIMILMLSVGRPYYFEEHFNFESISDLEARGWYILDKNEDLLKQQDMPGFLKLYTLNGDYWYTPPDSPVIENLLIRKINCNECDIIVKIVDFNPTENYQQAGFFLLDSKLTRNNNLRMTYAYNFRSFDDPVGTDEQKFQIIYREHGYPEEFSDFELSPTDEQTHRDSIYLRMKVRGYEVSFLKHVGEEYESFREITNAKVSLNFHPKYIGIAAFRGIRNAEGKRNESATIPAYFDYVKVRPLKN